MTTTKFAPDLSSYIGLIAHPTRSTFLFLSLSLSIYLSIYLSIPLPFHRSAISCQRNNSISKHFNVLHKVRLATMSGFYWYIHRHFYPLTNTLILSRVMKIFSDLSKPLTQESPGGVVANLLDCDIVVSEFEIQPCYYVDFWTNVLWKAINSFIPQLNSTTTVLLLEWL